MEKHSEDVLGNDERSVDIEEVKKHTRWKVNKTLLPLKMFYFFFYGASGSVIPFITVYLKHLQLTASETGLITGTAVFFAMSVRPLIGMVADNWSAWKSALIICCLGFGAAFFCLWFVPARSGTTSSYTNVTNSLDDVRPLQSHVGLRHGVWICKSNSGSPICSYPAIDNLTTCQKFSKDLHQTSSQIPQSDRSDTVNHVPPRPSLNDQLFSQDSDSPDISLESRGLGFDVQTDRDDVSSTNHGIQQDSGAPTPCLYTSSEPVTRENNPETEHFNTGGMKFHGIPSTKQISHTSVMETALPSKTMSPDVNIPMCLSDCVQYEVTNQSFTFNQSIYNVVDDVIITTGAGDRKRGRYQGNVTPDFVLFMPFLLIAVARSFYASSTSLADAVTYTILGPSSYKWGQQRLWGTIGTAVAVITITVSDDQLKGGKFAALFFVCFGLSVLAALIGGFKLRADKFPKSNSFWADMTRIISDGATRLFLTKLVFYGMMCGAATNFFMWFMVDLGSNHINLGLVVLVHCLSSVVCLRCSPRVLKGIGRANTINIVLIIYAIRYLAFSFLTSPWLALPVELLHGVTYSMFWAAASSTASILAPTGTQASYQSIAGAVYWDLGRGLGTLITGQILDVIGAPWTFRAYSVTCALVIPVIFLLDRRWPIGSQQTNIYIVDEEDEATGEAGDNEPVNIKLLNTESDGLSTEDEIRIPNSKEEIPHKLTTFASRQWKNTPISLGNGAHGTKDFHVLLSEKTDGGNKYDILTFRTITDTYERYLGNTIHTENGDVRIPKEYCTSCGSSGVLDNEHFGYPVSSHKQTPHQEIDDEEESSADIHFISGVSELNSFENIDKECLVDSAATRTDEDIVSRASLQTSVSSSQLDHYADVDLSYGGSFEDRLFVEVRPKSDSLIPNLSCRNLDFSDEGGSALTRSPTENPSAKVKHHLNNTRTCVVTRGLALNDNQIRRDYSAGKYLASVSEPSILFKHNPTNKGAVYGSADQILSCRQKNQSRIPFSRDPRVEEVKVFAISADQSPDFKSSSQK